MTDEEQKDKDSSRLSTLESLPADMKGLLDKLIAQGLGSIRIQSLIEDKFKNDKDKLIFLPASRSAYENYLSKHKERLVKEFSLSEELVEDANKSLDDLHNMIENGLDPEAPKESRKEVFEGIARNLDVQRIRISKMLTDNQTILAPQYETILVAIERERRNTIAKMHELEDVLNRNESEITFQKMKRLLQRFLDSVFLRVIAEVYKNEHLVEARTLASKYWKELWDSFRSEDEKQHKKEMKTKK